MGLYGNQEGTWWFFGGGWCKAGGMSNALEELRGLLVGQVVVSVDPPNAREAMVKLTLGNGTAFRLHATDLGWWVEKCAGAGGYTSLDDLARDYCHDAYNYDTSQPDPTVTLEGANLVVTAPWGSAMALPLANLSEEEVAALSNPEVLKLFSLAIPCGSCWRAVLHDHPCAGVA